MVCVATMQAQREHFDKNLGKYKKEHPGEWIIIDSNIRATFYKTEEDYNKALEPYRNSFGPGILHDRIPFDRKKAEYNFEVKLQVNWNELEKAIGPFETAEIVLKARPYVGLFTVYNNRYLSRGSSDSLEKKVAVLNLNEPSNFEIINRKENKPVHAHLEDNKNIKNQGKIIEYTPKQIKSAY